MTGMTGDGVCVIIAAKDAADTIGKAIASALAEAPVREVVVVDDGSSDGTADVGRALDDGSGRVKVIRFDRNRGPSAARNAAIAASSSPLISILDADDFFFPGRFEAMLQETNWDLIADNIGFIHHDASMSVQPDRFHPRTRQLSLIDFVNGNISKRGTQRGEIGFLKPVIRRDFLLRHSLRYNEDLRLGEDYDLYLRALALGARYKVIDHCGYGAVVRANSLSGRHRTEDLGRLYRAEKAIRETLGLLDAQQAAAVLRHERQIKARYELRNFLDIGKSRGKPAAILHMLGRPDAAPAIISGVLGDKLDAVTRARKAPPAPVPAGQLRYLLPAVPVAQK
ncbi:glycosyltransferase family 2 protein [Rhizobium oryzicola]|uniref:Glycosyltransferase family 2 protein n=1 Tax=Rhizobium oryzicola TaxID=1232668 RepID=A0ABT8T097_9HYPH|nr:glycosyltransferase family 2 protein [Rhizobium oryzicola]MDO1584175.1 glycosyltransferase family 2 protein [Rhizobium oryzicola]